MIENELPVWRVNTLVLRIDCGYRYQTHPEPAGENSLEKEDLVKLVAA